MLQSKKGGPKSPRPAEEEKGASQKTRSSGRCNTNEIGQKKCKKYLLSGVKKTLTRNIAPSRGPPVKKKALKGRESGTVEKRLLQRNTSEKTCREVHPRVVQRPKKKKRKGTTPTISRGLRTQ